VAIEEAPLRRLAARVAALTGARAAPPAWDEFGWHHIPGASAATIALFVVVLNSVNFCFWPSEGEVQYEQLARGLARAAGGPDFTASALARCSAADVARWVPGLHDAEERAARVREVAAVLARDFGGCALALIDSARGSAAALVRTVGDAFPGFRDEALYLARSGARACARQVLFYKRAQILVGDLWGALGRAGGAGGGPAHAGAAFRDMAALTCFADYRIPQLLEAEGVLVYAPALRARVRAKEELPPGCAEEVEIRAATVEAVHRITKVAEVLHGRQLTAVEMDWCLWNLGEARELAGELPPHHRTRSVFY
jgi:hypothetical protein